MNSMLHSTGTGRPSGPARSPSSFPLVAILLGAAAWVVALVPGAAEVLQYDWDNCIVERGDSRKHLPWNLGQFGSNTSFTMTRTNYVAAMDALTKLKEIAVIEFGGSVDDYAVGDERVYSSADESVGLSYAEAAQKAIELGGRFSGQDVPDDINPMTRSSVAALAAPARSRRG